MHSRQRKYATTSEAAIRELVLKGMKWADIAAQLNVPRAQLQMAASLLGIRQVSRRADIDSTKPWWIPAMANGAAIATIAKAEGCSEFKIVSALKKQGLPTSHKAAAEYLRNGGKASAVAHQQEGGSHAA